MFLIANLTLKNISKEQKAQSTSFAVNLNVTGDQNISYRAIPAVPPEPLKGELFPDGTAKGQVVFEVPASEKNLMFIVTESMSFDTNLRQFIAIDPDASITPDPSLRKVAPTDIGRKRDTPAKIGETLVAGQWEFSILQTVRDNDAATLITEANQFNDPAPADQEYVAIRFKARYLGTDDPDRSENISGTFLKITGEKNVVYEHLPVVPPKPNIDSMLFAGGSAEGWTVASVSKGEKGLKLIFEPLFSFGQDNIRFITIE